MRLKIKAWFIALCCLMAVATVAFSDDYPTHSVRLLVG